MKNGIKTVLLVAAIIAVGMAATACNKKGNDQSAQLAELNAKMEAMQAELDKAKSANAAPEEIAKLEAAVAEQEQQVEKRREKHGEGKGGNKQQSSETETTAQAAVSTAPAASTASAATPTATAPAASTATTTTTPAASQSVATTTPASSTPNPASDFSINGTLLYQYNGRGYKNVIIPNGVTAIGDNVFRAEYGVVSVTIPESVTSIGDYAFYDCVSLNSVTINGNITTDGIWGFSGENVTSITIGKNGFIPNIAKKINGNKLATINVDPANTSFSSQDGVLYNKNKTILIKYPAGKIGSTFTIPNSVTSIGEGAFSGAILSSVNIPNSVTSIGGGTFKGCFHLASVNIPNSVTSIGGQAFSQCANLKEITIPDGVTIIEGETFASTNLVSVNIPNSVTNIRYKAFYYNRFTSITIPKSVTKIEREAFIGCSSLTSITFEGTIPADVLGSIYTGVFLSPFDGDLRDKYLAGGPGTYTPTGTGKNSVWTKQ